MHLHRSACGCDNAALCDVFHCRYLPRLLLCVTHPLQAQLRTSAGPHSPSPPNLKRYSLNHARSSRHECGELFAAVKWLQRTGP